MCKVRVEALKGCSAALTRQLSCQGSMTLWLPGGGGVRQVQGRKVFHQEMQAKAAPNASEMSCTGTLADA